LGDRSPTQEERIWLEGIAAGLEQVEKRVDWGEFLKEVALLPAVALPYGSKPEGRVTSGNFALIRVTTRCNAECEFCNARGVMPDLVEDPQQIQSSIRAAARDGYQTVSFTGGEPTLLKNLPELIRLANVEDLDVDLQTNGILLARPKLIEPLVAAGLKSIFLSFHSADSTIHDDMLKVKGAFSKAVRCIELCLEAGIEVRYNCVITTLNLEGVVDLVKYVYSRFRRKGAHVCLSFVSMQGWALDHPELIPRLSQAAPKMAAALDAGLELGLDVRIPGLCGVPICVLPGYEERFDEYNDPNPPPKLPTRAFVPACEECPYRSRCSGFWKEYIDRFGDRELGMRQEGAKSS
jgi:MoaA/NifB/PqqE/SkfB family radical SAM enzyme